MNGPIICGVDESESSKGAARVARILGSELGLGVIFVRALKAGVPDSEVNSVTDRLERLAAGANDADCGAGWSVDVGHPVDVLIAAARQAQASMIVVGSTGSRSSLLGSVSADVSRRAPCPLVVVSPGAGASVDRRSAHESDPLKAGSARV